MMVFTPDDARNEVLFNNGRNKTKSLSSGNEKVATICRFKTSKVTLTFREGADSPPLSVPPQQQSQAASCQRRKSSESNHT